MNKTAVKYEDLFKDKIKSLDELAEIAARARADGKTIAFTNGCFDLLHVGHIRYLLGAKYHADIVITGVNSDASVRAIKGPERPYLNERDRMILVAAIAAVDYVVLFAEPRADRLLLALKPDFHAKGADYTVDSVPEKDVVASYGGKVIITGDPKDHSTTGAIARIKERLYD